MPLLLLFLLEKRCRCGKFPQKQKSRQFLSTEMLRMWPDFNIKLKSLKKINIDRILLVNVEHHGLTRQLSLFNT